MARRMGRGRVAPTGAMRAFLEKIAPVADFGDKQPASIRAGMIPCGGVVAPVAARRVMLVGDAAGMVSPVTAGGIHTALKHGLAAGHAIADFLGGRKKIRAAGSCAPIHDSAPSARCASCSITSKAICCST
ncbi:MAG: NAD(P)/FAD-dependent oxidoreductase [Longimicrobiales bacterium]